MKYQLLHLDPNVGFIQKIVGILQRRFILTLVGFVIIGVLNQILLKFGISIEDQSRLIEGVGNRSWKEVLMFVMIAGPIIEELLFRAWITGKWYWVLISGIALGISLFRNGYQIIGLLFVITGLIISGCIYFRLIKINPKIIFYSVVISSIVFGLVHINNFKGFHGREVLIISPQLILGFLLGYVRVAYGIQYSIFLHIFHNSIVGFGIVAAKYLQLWPLDESSLNKPGMSTLLILYTIYYGVIFGTIIISFFYQHDLIKSNNREKKYQPIK